MSEMKGEKLIIRCSKKTKMEFKVWVLENEFKNMEEALSFLLCKARELKLRPERAGKIL